MKYNQYYKDDQNIQAIRTAIESFDHTNIEEIDKIDKYIELFLKLNHLNENNIEETELYYQAIEHYLMVVLLVSKHTNIGTGWAKGTFEDFIISAIRIMELLLYVAYQNDKALNNVFLNKEDDSYYNHLRQISYTIGPNEFEIKKEGTANHLWFKFADKKKSLCRSSIVVQSFQKEGNLFEQYFKLNDLRVKRLYEMDFSDNRIEGRNPNEVWGKRIPFGKVTKVEELVISINRLAKIDEFEPNAYTHIKTLQNPQVNSEVARLVDEEKMDQVQNADTRSGFKRYMIVKAVGNNIVKKNLVLSSDYNRPEFEHLCEITNELIKTDNLYSDIILWSILIGVSVEKVLTMFLATDDDFSYSLLKKTLKIRPSSLFSDQVISPYAHEVVSQFGYIEFEDWLHMWWDRTSKYIFSRVRSMNLYEILSYVEKNIDEMPDKQNHILRIANKKFKDELQNTDKIRTAITNFKKSLSEDEKVIVAKIKPAEILIDIVKNETSQYLIKHLAKKNKTINLSLGSLAYLNMHFYCLFQGGPTANLLFVTHKSKSDEAKLTYSSVNHMLLNYQKWLHEFADAIGIKQFLQKYYSIKSQTLPSVHENLKIGSRLYIKPGNFKNFLLVLSNLDVINEYDKINLLMIVIRYMLCISLATRQATFSSSINDYSKRLKILFLQEKAKNMFSSKRAIPLSDRALELIGWFEKVKSKYALASDVPVLLKMNDSGKITEQLINKRSIEEYLHLICGNDQDKEFLLKFVRYTNLNFGRHIFTSITSSDNTIQQKYIDAFLGHYAIGTEDQGHFSDFSNKDYIATMRDVIKEIERHYFPFYLGVEKYVP